MHEWALAEAVIKAASEIAEKKKLGEISEVIIKVGELQQVEQEILQFALLQIRPPKFIKATFKIETEKARLKCRMCGHAWVFERKNVDEVKLEAIHFVPEIAHSYIQCPKCLSPDFEILEGRGVLLQSIRGSR